MDLHGGIIDRRAVASAFTSTIQGSGTNVRRSGTISLPAGTAMHYKYV
jgi:alpha-amylase